MGADLDVDFISFDVPLIVFWTKSGLMPWGLFIVDAALAALLLFSFCPIIFPVYQTKKKVD